jgi:hypothetical protein
MPSDPLLVKLLSVISTFGVVVVLHGRENFLFGRNVKRNGSWSVLIREDLIVPSGL